MGKSSSTRPAQTTSSGSPIVFGGALSYPSPEVFEEARRSNPVWVQLLEKAYERITSLPGDPGLYGDMKKGATLEQVWLFFTLMGTEPYCLLAYAIPKAQTGKITRLSWHSARDLVDTLKRVQSADGFINASTLHYDGRTGHCIRIVWYDRNRDRFIYHDPWPLKSLLCSENNLAGVQAQAEGKRWSITSKELEQVIFASFLFPHQWARLQGVNFDLSVGKWKQTEFFSFFNLEQVHETSAGELSTRGFSIGSFKDLVLIVDSGKHDKILRGILILKRHWMRDNLMLAADLTKSFIRVFAPAPDRPKYGEISDAVWSLRNGGAIEWVVQQASGASPIVDCLRTFVGAATQGSVGTDFGHLNFENFADEVEQLLKVEFTLF